MGHTPPTPERVTGRRFLFQAVGLAAIMLLSLSCYLLVLKWRETRDLHRAVGRLSQFARLGG